MVKFADFCKQLGDTENVVCCTWNKVLSCRYTYSFLFVDDSYLFIEACHTSVRCSNRGQSMGAGTGSGQISKSNRYVVVSSYIVFEMFLSLSATDVPV